MDTMTAYEQLDDAAQRKGWETTSLARQPLSLLWSRLFVKDDLIVEAFFSGNTIHSAVLYDGQTNTEYRLTRKDQNKATRVADVLLGNSRRF